MTNLSHVPHTLGEEFVSPRSIVGLLSYRSAGKVVAFLDYFLIVAACVIGGLAYSHLVLSESIIALTPYIGVGSVAAVIFVALSYSQYSVRALIDFPLQFKNILRIWSAVILIFCLMFFLLKIGAYHSRGALVLFGAFGFGALVGSRWFISSRLATALARGTLPGTPAVLIGDVQSLAHMSRRDLVHKFGAREVARFELPPLANDRRAVLAVIDKAIESSRSNLAELVLLALPWAQDRQRDVVCERLQVLPVSVSLLPDQKVNSLLSRSGRIGTDFTIELQRPPLSAGELTAKRVFDLLLATTLTVLLAPLLGIIALLIKIDLPGPVFFRQHRRGFNSREFTIYKFRTMHVLEDGHEIRQAQRHDPRVTRLGSVLRATSIDELPQLINVIRGQMSLVGPRPHAVAHDDGYAKLIANYAFRQHVRPGLTGWAQVNGFRGETARLELMEQRVKHDLWYIKHWSFWLDLRIVALTCFELVRRQDVY